MEYLGLIQMKNCEICGKKLATYEKENVQCIVCKKTKKCETCDEIFINYKKSEVNCLKCKIQLEKQEKKSAAAAAAIVKKQEKKSAAAIVKKQEKKSAAVIEIKENEVKCTACKKIKNKQEFMKDNKQLKTCFSCREKNSEYSKKYKCVHNMLKERCIECDGSFICRHKKYKSQCKECGWKEKCEHGWPKYFCKDCKVLSYREYMEQQKKIEEEKPLANVKQIEIPPENLQHEEDLFFGRITQ
jgi:hypothetical protein